MRQSGGSCLQGGGVLKQRSNDFCASLAEQLSLLEGQGLLVPQMAREITAAELSLWPPKRRWWQEDIWVSIPQRSSRRGPAPPACPSTALASLKPTSLKSNVGTDCGCIFSPMGDLVLEVLFYENWKESSKSLLCKINCACVLSLSTLQCWMVLDRAFF